MKSRGWALSGILSLTLVFIFFLTPAQAQQEIRIGFISPATGSMARTPARKLAWVLNFFWGTGRPIRLGGGRFAYSRR